MIEVGDVKFEMFIDDATTFAQALGLTDWELHFKQEWLGEGTVALTEVNFVAHAALIRLTTHVQEQSSIDNLEQIAHHEVLELLLSELKFRPHFPTNEAELESRIHQAAHCVIHRLLCILFKD
jgi:hypothetical protein